MTDPTTTTTATFALDPSQERAVELVCTARLGVVTGGPGTGKTTCLRTALDRLDATGGVACPSCKGKGAIEVHDDFGGDSYEDTCPSCSGSGRTVSYALAAPTGKAARRMSEATGRDARTVHRLLAYGPMPGGGVGFNHHAKCPLSHDLVVVDEASMLDVELADALFDAIDPLRTRLVLVGDVNQLPSVGPGRVFGDLIESDAVPVARLEKLHRAAAESWVCSQAPRILAGELPDLVTRLDFVWTHVEDRDKASSALVDVVTKHLPASRGASGEDVQVLMPQRVGPAGAEALNVRLQAILNPPTETSVGWKIGAYTIREGDRVIQTSNDYFLGVMNGEVGRVAWVREKPTTCPVCDGRKVVEIDDEEARRTVERDCERCAGKGSLPPGLGVKFPEGRGERLVEYSKTKASDGLALAYALTIHKSQGSEWPWVVVFVHSTHTMMLTRQLLYTAITRAKTGVVIVGDRAGIERAVKETKDATRNTALVERLRAA